MVDVLPPEAWGLSVGAEGELTVHGVSVTALAEEYGTPLHVVDETRLVETAIAFRQSVEAAYLGPSSVHYAFKCNSVPGVVECVRKARLKAEVMSEFELELALRLGYDPSEVLVNGPCKTQRFLRKCVEERVRLVVVDSLDELTALMQVTDACQQPANVLLRVNPDYVARSTGRAATTGSRHGCAFGLDLKGGEVGFAMGLLKGTPLVAFQGFHFHIGTGIRDPRDYAWALRCLRPLLEESRSAGLPVRIVDVGGGFASMTTREMTSQEALLYHGFNLMPRGVRDGRHAGFRDFAREIAMAVLDHFPVDELPELIYEPGRCIASANQFLLLTVHHVKRRPGIAPWFITDGGLGTVTMPTYYEYHEVLLCNDVTRPRSEKGTIVGPVCFGGDVVYRNKPMPTVRPGEVLAVMDSGAYFTALESSFGFARPAIVAVSPGGCRVIRRRETFDDMVSRDVFRDAGGGRP